MIYSRGSQCLKSFGARKLSNLPNMMDKINLSKFPQIANHLRTFRHKLTAANFSMLVTKR